MELPEIEEKFREVRRYIQNNEIKTALKRCNNYLHKSGHVKFYAQKCEILLKMHKTADCVELMETIGLTAAEDNEALEIFIHLYKMLRQHDKVTELYQEAFKLFATEKRGRALYEYYGYQFKFLEQQKLSLKLYKLYRNLEYAEWTAFSMIVMSEIEPKHTKMLEIANLLYIKIKDKEGFEYTESFLRLDLEIQQRILMHEEAIAILETYGSIIPDPIERVAYLAKLHYHKGDIITSLNCYHSVLSQNLMENTAKDLWHITTIYIDSVFDFLQQCMAAPNKHNNFLPTDPTAYTLRVLDSGPRYNLWKAFNGNETIINIMVSALANIRFTRELLVGRLPIVEEVRRQSYLAEMEFKKRIIYYNFAQGSEEYRSENDTGGIFYALVLKYVSKYFELPNCVDDLVPFLPLLNASQLVPFKEKLDEFMMKLNGTTSIRPKLMSMSLAYFKLLRIVGMYTPPLLKHVGQLWEVIKAIQKAYTEFSYNDENDEAGFTKPGDELILLLAEILTQKKFPHIISEAELQNSDFGRFTFEDEKDSHFNMRIYTAICLLEIGLKRSPSNIHIKTALLNLYTKFYSVFNIDRLYNSLNLKGSDFEYRSYIILPHICNFRMFIKDLEIICRNVKEYHESFFYDLMPKLNVFYNKYDLKGVKKIYDNTAWIKKSYYKYLCDYLKVYVDFYKSIVQPGQMFARVLRDNLMKLNIFISTASIEYFSITADNTILYACGNIRVRSITQIKSKHSFATEELHQNPFEFRERAKGTNFYGQLGKVLNVKLEALCLRILMDITEKNLDSLDIQLREFNRVISQLGLMDRTEISKSFSSTITRTMTREHQSIKEEARDARFEEPVEAFTGNFASEEDFKKHQKFLQSYFWKVILMLFEGSFRLIYSNTVKLDEHRKQSKDPSRQASRNSRMFNTFDRAPEDDITDKLCNFQHIERHFVILNIMMRDITNSIIPKEDYLKKLQIGLNKIHVPDDESKEIEDEEDSSTIETIYPGMLKVISDFLHGPVMYSILLFTTWINNLPEKLPTSQMVTRSMVNEQEALENTRSVIKDYIHNMYTMLTELYSYLEGQKNSSYLEKKAKDYMKHPVFKYYCTLGAEDPQFISKINQSIKKGHEQIINSILKTINYMKRIPRPGII